MAASTVTVVSNANRLRKVDIRPSYEIAQEASEERGVTISTAKVAV
jgi:hypothetical protein